MKYFKNNITAILPIVTLMLFFTGCDVSNSDSADSNARMVAVKMKAPSLKQKADQNTQQGVNSLTEVKMLVEKMELENSLDRDHLDFKVRDLVVNLPLDGSELDITQATVPEGEYSEFEMDIEKPYRSSVQDPDFYDQKGTNSYSVVIKGTYNGKAFTYRSREDFELELDFNPPLKVSADAAPSIAINVDPYSWFKDRAGNDLNPSDPANVKQIDDNIEKSFEVDNDVDQDDKWDEDDDWDDDDDDDGDDD